MQTPNNPNRTYDVPAVEQKWRTAWREHESHAVLPVEGGDTGKYVFVTPPFTSGDAHMGHVRSYTIGDAYARYRRSRGDAVLFSLGFDAFGLPSEISAFEHSMSPPDWVDRCVRRMREQFDELGISFDWSRSFVSSDPEIYRWSQWLFLELLDANMIYQREGQVEWCDDCQTVLANLQVEDGCCWRCHNEVRLVWRRQWYLRRSAYNEQNDVMDWPEGWNKLATAAQRAILGRVDGVEFDAQSFDGTTLTVFTPYSDQATEARFILLSPNHPDVEAWTDDPGVQAKLADIRRDGLQRADRKLENVTIVDTGHLLMVPAVPQPLPVLVSPIVDSLYGPTAILGVPAASEVDRQIAEHLPKQAEGVWRGTNSKSTSSRPATRYRAGDFSISRQRSWGAPIPMVVCADCGTVPVPRDELPVMLPADLVFKGAENALATHPSFRECRCPKCGAAAERETDTLDCHIDAAWSEFPHAVPPDSRSINMFEHDELRSWLPVSYIIQGSDNGAFTLNMRVAAKVLRDRGVLAWLGDGEPFGGAVMHEMVQMDGRKMSKHLGNVVSPLELVGQSGADAVRFAVLHAAAPIKSFSWSDQALRFAIRFLDEVYAFSHPRLTQREISGTAGEPVTKMRRRLASWCDIAIDRVTANFDALDMHKATRNVVRMFESIVYFEEKASCGPEGLTPSDRQAVFASLLLLVRMLSPLAPHIAEELWELGGMPGLVCEQPWPTELVRADGWGPASESTAVAEKVA